MLGGGIFLIFMAPLLLGAVVLAAHLRIKLVVAAGQALQRRHASLDTVGWAFANVAVGILASQFGLAPLARAHFGLSADAAAILQGFNVLQVIFGLGVLLAWLLERVDLDA